MVRRQGVRASGWSSVSPSVGVFQWRRERVNDAPWRAWGRIDLAVNAR